MRTRKVKHTMMTRRELETILLTLESTPALLARAAAELHEDRVRQRGTTGGFSLVEHVWHLADLEREGYGARIRRLLTEEEPQLLNFDGDRVARERVYHRRDLAEGLLAFTAARTRNLQTLRELSPADWKRSGEQEGIGMVALADVPRMMAEHDRVHGVEIAELVRELRDGIVTRGERSVSAVA
jgi:DinB family protein